MPVYRSPGVYLEEIRSLPASVAQVETALPAFIGFTERATDGASSLTNKPTRVRSRVAYNAAFGGGPAPAVTVDLSGDKINSVSLTPESPLYDSLRLFWDNGGGDCFVVSIGSHSEAGTKSEPDKLNLIKEALAALTKVDEVTLIVAPLIASMQDPNAGGARTAILRHCADMMDRFAILDVPDPSSPSAFDKSIDDFRTGVGANGLAYGAAYLPSLVTAYGAEVRYQNLTLKTGDLKTALSGSAPVGPAGKVLSNVEIAKANLAAVDKALEALRTDSTANKTYASAEDRFEAALLKGGTPPLEDAVALLATAFIEASLIKLDDKNNLKKPEDIPARGGGAASKPLSLIDELSRTRKAVRPAVERLAALDLFGHGLSSDPLTKAPSATANRKTDIYDKLDGPLAAPTPELTESVIRDATTGAAALPFATAALREIATELVAALRALRATADQILASLEASLATEHPLYARILAESRRATAVVPPSGAIAGVYASVDRDRGVWHAPAARTLNGVVGVTQTIDRRTQDGLNIHPATGKSLNAIRAFKGEGIRVWGARTLAGNDPEWCYIQVRRLFNMVEESIQDTMRRFVFEPNDANTWVQVKATIDNYLDQLWRQGALQGTKPAEAFFVNVGLGRSMTAADILAGKLVIEVGMAAVRPAEFVILRFNQIQQAS